MEKMKLLTAILFCLGIAGMASADELINIDLNKQGNDVAYSGGAAYTPGGSTLWRAYYGGYPEGWGKAMGSERTANLADHDEPNIPSTYAAQVWIGADMNNCTTYGPCDVNLMDDGFVNTGGPNDPNPGMRLWGIDAYEGTYNIYVHGANDGNFTLTCPLRDPNSETKHVDGWSGLGFVEGKNFVVFEDVNIGDEANAVTISYDNVLNGLQIVKLTQRVAIDKSANCEGPNTTCIEASEYDVAYETNARPNEPMHFGPDFEDAGASVAYLDAGEYMEYDITVDDTNKGYYAITAYVDTDEGDVVNLEIYIDDILLGSFGSTATLHCLCTDCQCWTDGSGGPPYAEGEPSTIYGNLFAGNYTLKWRTPSQQYFNIWRLKLRYIGPIEMNDCDDVYFYGFNYAGDYTGDCRVDLNDLKLVVDDWLNCHDPNTANCP